MILAKRCTFICLSYLMSRNLDSVLKTRGSLGKPRHHIKKNRDITLPPKVHIVKGVVLPVVMYGYESWTIKKAEDQITHAFILWCWRTLKRALVQGTARWSNQLILKEINPEYSLEEMMLKLKLQYFDHMMLRADSLEKTLGKIFGKDVGKNWQEEKRTTEDEMVGWPHSLSGHEFEQIRGDSDGQWSLVCCSPWGGKELDIT